MASPRRAGGASFVVQGSTPARRPSLPDMLFPEGGLSGASMLAQPSLSPPRADLGLQRRRRFRAPLLFSVDEDGARALPRGDAGPAREPPLLLIVDDDALMTTLLPRTLRKGFGPELRIATATTPDEAARILRELRPDIVLSDYNLRAVKTGLDVLADAAGVVPDAVRILFSGHTQGEIGPAMDTVPIHGFIEKPFRLDELVEPLARLVQEAGLQLPRASDEDR